MIFEDEFIVSTKTSMVYGISCNKIIKQEAIENQNYDKMLYNLKSNDRHK